MKIQDRYATVQFCQFYFEVVVEYNTENDTVQQSIDAAYTKNGEVVTSFTLTEAHELLKNNSVLNAHVQAKLDELSDLMYEELNELEDDQDDQDTALEAWRERVGYRY